MKACVLPSPAPVETGPLHIVELPKPRPTAGQVLIRVHACGICRTDLHVVEGELPARKSPVVPLEALKSNQIRGAAVLKV